MVKRPLATESQPINGILTTRKPTTALTISHALPGFRCINRKAMRRKTKAIGNIALLLRYARPRVTPNVKNVGQPRTEKRIEMSKLAAAYTSAVTNMSGASRYTVRRLNDDQKKRP